MAIWVDPDTGKEVEVDEMQPKPRRGKVTKTEQQIEQAGKDAVVKREELGKDYVSPIREDYPPVAEPPNHSDAELAVLETAVEVFADEMSPAERSRMKREIEVLREQLDEAQEVKAITDAEDAVKKPRGKVTVVNQPEQSLTSKLIEVMAAVDAVEKKGSNDAQHYRYQRATDVFNAVRPEFIKRGLLFVTTIDRSQTTMIERGGGKSPSILVEVDAKFRVTDGYDELVFSGSAAGIDTGGDKAIYKAITGAMKYGIRQLLMLPDENDPEIARPGEREDLEGPTGPATITISSATPVAVKQGGRQTMATSAQLNAIKKVARERSIGPEALAAFIVSTLGTGPALDPMDSDETMAGVVLDYLGNLPFEECGKVVRGLMEAGNAADGAA